MNDKLWENYYKEWKEKMVKLKVYFIDFKIKLGYNMFDKFENFVKKVGIGIIDFKNKFVVIKVYFGEFGNFVYIRLNYVVRIVKFIKSFGGKLFVIDVNIFYIGRRSNVLDYLEVVYENGFNLFVFGCYVIIVDGLKGIEYREIEVNFKYI